MTQENQEILDVLTDLLSKATEQFQWSKENSPATMSYQHGYRVACADAIREVQFYIARNQ